MHPWLAALLLSAGCATATAAAPPRALLSNGAPLTKAQENAGERIALSYHHAAASGLLAADFRNHDIEQSLPQPDAAPLFTLTEGDLTMLAYPTAGNDPGARFASNLFEVQDAHITQMWTSGPTAAPATGTPPAPIANGDTTREQRCANKRLVQQFIHDFLVDGDTKVAAYVISPTIRSHVQGVPSGPDFAAVAYKHQDRVAAPDPAQELFALAEGELVAIGFPISYAGDPGAWYAQTIVRVQNGKITEWWYSGYPAGHPRRK